MKKLGLGVLAFLLGQAVVLYKKDPALQKAIKKSDSFSDRFKIFANRILSYNKELFQESKEFLSEKDFGSFVGQLHQKKTEILEKIHIFKTQIENTDKEQIAGYIKDAEIYMQDVEIFLTNIKEKLQDKYHTLKESYDFEKVLGELRSFIKAHLQSSQKKVSSRAITKK